MADLIETSHGLATKEHIIEHDMPYWRDAADHAIRVFNDLAMKTGQRGYFSCTLAPDKPK